LASWRTGRLLDRAGGLLETLAFTMRSTGWETDAFMTAPDTIGHMDLALAEAHAAAARGEVPVGAVIVSPAGEVVASAGNRTRELNDPTAHAEIVAIRAACAATSNERLVGHDLYVTLEPCPMCAAAVSFARIRRLVWGAADPKMGGVEHGARVFTHATCHHRPELTSGVRADEAAALLRAFFAERRR
jgi:tRNA(adenine34) deaminase